MRIHLGCGDKYWPGFVNVDMIGGDVVSDVLKLDFGDEIAHEIHAIHLFEHLHRMEAASALKEWMRVLIPGGKIILEMPCLDKIVQLINNGEQSLTKTLFGLYGDVRLGRPEMLHKWCYSQAEILSLFEEVGLKNIKLSEPFFHLMARDMRIEGVK